jgi:palmitoyltransferase
MTVTHWYYILHNVSTIESFAISDMRHAENVALNREYGMLHLKTKKNLVKNFDQEWGKLSTEANMWWLGDKKSNWKLVMGPKVLAWIRRSSSHLTAGYNRLMRVNAVPPPKYRPDDGLHYEVNPRRGPDGLWRRRTDWPAELR